MKSERVLPILVYCDAAISILSIAVNRALAGLSPSPPASVASGDIVLTTLWMAVNAATVLAWIGLLNLWRPARAIYFWTWVATLLLLPLESAWIFAPVGYMLDSAATLVGGAVLGLLYFSDAGAPFARPAIGSGATEARV